MSLTTSLLGGRYEIIEVLGSGGMGNTYIAKDTQRPSHPKCVVKQFHPASNSPKYWSIAKRLFEKEAETLEQLGQHDQIPQLFAYFEENQEFYLVQELIEGHPLSDELSPGKRCPESEVLQLLKEVLPILEFIHSQGVIHRDIKPENLIRRASDNKLVLIDFGAVKQVRLLPTTSPKPVSVTVAIGTPGYMSMESAFGQPSPASDIYALGMTAIQALTGLPPIQLRHDTNGEVVWQNQAEVSQKLADFLTKMVRYQLPHRYQTATEALASLQEILKFNSQSTIVVKPPIKSNKKRLIFGLATLSVIVSVLGSWFTAQGGKTPWGGDNMLTVGVLASEYNSPEKYSPLVAQLKSELGVNVKLDIIESEDKDAIKNSKTKIKAKEWDIAFATAPLTSATASQNNYLFAARMFPNAPQYETAIFVRKDSPITSLDDLKANTKIALGEFDSAAFFYMPVYDLYGKILRVNVGNSLNTIVQKVKSGEVDVGAGVYGLIEKDPDLRVINQSRGIPLSGVYLSPELSHQEKRLVKNALLNAPSDIQKDAAYGEGKEIDYTQFIGITRRVDEILGCTDFTQEVIKFYCENSPASPSPSNLPKIAGKVNGFQINDKDTNSLTLQGQDGEVYRVILPTAILNQDPNLPSLPGLNFKNVEVIGVEPIPANGTMELPITNSGQVKISE